MGWPCVRCRFPQELSSTLTPSCDRKWGIKLGVLLSDVGVCHHCVSSPVYGKPFTPPRRAEGSRAHARGAGETSRRNFMKFSRTGTHIAWCCFAFLAMLVMTPPVAAQAQAGTGQIVGTVYDAGRLVVAQASVTLSNKDTGFQREEKTNEEGGYRFLLLPVGNY